MKRILAALLCLLLFAGVLAGCAKNEPEPEPSQSESEPEVVHLPKNLLTGVEGLSDAAVGKRPIAIMINNIRAALPQYGISDADILVETLVEGGITRMMALYGDYTKIPDVCTIRSCRFYYPIIALSFDAVYIHWGEETNWGSSTLRDLNVDHLSGDWDDGGIFDRDRDRLNEGYAWEHTGYAHGAKIPEALNSLGMRSTLKSGFTDPMFLFAEETEKVLPEGSGCVEAKLEFSSSYYSTFTYDEASHTYRKQHSGNLHIDAKSGKQLAFENVLVLETSITNLTDILMNVETTGSGSGYWLSEGKMQKIRWSKPDEFSKIKLTDTAGKELTINAGKSYIGYIRPDCSVFIAPPTPPAESSAESSASN